MDIYFGRWNPSHFIVY